MFGKWIVLEGISSPLKYQITRSILKSYPGAMMHMDDDALSLEKILKLKENIQDHLSKNISVICSSWISSTLAKAQPNSKELCLVHEILKSSRPDLSVALLTSDSDYERRLSLSRHIDLVLNVKHVDEHKISRLVLDHLLYN